MNNQTPEILIKQRTQLIQEVVSLQEFIRGTLVKTQKKCGRKSCKCEKGLLHPHIYISTSRKRQNQVLYIRPNEVRKAEHRIKNYRKLTETLDKISQVNIALLKLERNNTVKKGK
jgi:hypothetical protein